MSENKEELMSETPSDPNETDPPTKDTDKSANEDENEMVVETTSDEILRPDDEPITEISKPEAIDTMNSLSDTDDEIIDVSGEQRDLGRDWKKVKDEFQKELNVYGEMIHTTLTIIEEERKNKKKNDAKL